jgi:hypothetical protein
MGQSIRILVALAVIAIASFAAVRVAGGAYQRRLPPRAFGPTTTIRAIDDKTVCAKERDDITAFGNSLALESALMNCLRKHGVRGTDAIPAGGYTLPVTRLR